MRLEGKVALAISDGARWNGSGGGSAVLEGANVDAGLCAVHPGTYSPMNQQTRY